MLQKYAIILKISALVLMFGLIFTTQNILPNFSSFARTSANTETNQSNTDKNSLIQAVCPGAGLNIIGTQ